MRLKHSVLHFALALGSLGAAAFILSHYFFVRGKYMLVVYAAFVIVLSLTLRRESLASYWERFQAGLGAFMVAAFAHYLFVIVERQVVTVISPFGHLWRLGFLLLVGAAINLALARLSHDRQRLQA